MTAHGLRRGGVLASLVLVGCAFAPSGASLDPVVRETLHASFRDQGIATVDRLDQDAVQQACSAETPPTEGVARQLQAAAQATIRWPDDGVYLGDWREGEKLAQNGRGMTWTDPAGVPSGGNCYNCHQMTKAEISFGTIGPSLLAYGRLRGVSDPLAPQSAAVVQYTWGKLWNSKATSACSAMPRFGHAGVLSPAQIRDLMALLLDPKSPVNAP
jgi:sulfur-oxidizing protein SoxX